MNEIIDRLWERVYSATQSHSAAKTFGSFLSLPPRFDQDLLNDIARLRVVPTEDQAALIEKIRGCFCVARTTGLIGESDILELYQMLDTIEKGE